ncbi:MAG: AraC family transcriptional regulator [Steroidobacteraceae bacterium]
MSVNPARITGFASSDVRVSPRPETVDVDALRCFPELVQQLGGDANLLFRRARVDPAVFDNPGSVVDYRSLLLLLGNAAEELSCPDFGLRLAAIQGGNKMLGPIGVVMKHSKTLGQAIGYCARNTHVYSSATHVRFEPDRAKHQLLVRLEILLDRMPDKRQAVEHAFMLSNQNIIEITGGAARVRKVLFSHEPDLDPKSYRTFFGCDVSFGQKADCFILTEKDLSCPIADPDSRVYEMATSFIEARYPPVEPAIHTRVRGFVQQYLGSRDCTNERIAAKFCMHPRTLLRRLRAEGASFEEIKDEVRRDVALQYIQNADIPLKRVAEKLGYAETSVLSRSCFRWFSATPRQLRLRLKSAVSSNKQTGRWRRRNTSGRGATQTDIAEVATRASRIGGAANMSAP